MQYTTSTECSECGAKSIVQSTSAEPVLCCPFCGEEVVVSYDDIEDETTLERDFDEDNEDEG